MDTYEKSSSSPQSKNVRLQNKFLLGLASILFFFSAIASTVIYFYELSALENAAYQQAELVMAATEANRRYVREVLRPKMYELVGNERFYIEAMSSSYISRIIMDRFKERIPEFSYRRVAINARNQNYEADVLEQEMIAYFSENPAIDEWHGIIKQNDEKYFMRFKPVYFEESCANCHGNPQSAPKQIIEMYGDTRGFYREPGQVLGVISVGLPVDLNLIQIKEITLIAFFGVIPSLLILYFIITFFFNHFIVHNIQNVLSVFRDNLKDEQDIALLDETKKMDEIGQLTDVAHTLSGKLKESRQQLEQYAAEMVASKELLQSVFDGITDPVVLIESDQTIKVVNRAFLVRYHLEMNQVISHHPKDVPTDKCCPLKQCQDIFDNMPAVPINREIQVDNGDIFLIYFYPIHHEKNDNKSLVCYVKDITEQKKLEIKFQQTEKLISIGQLAAGIAHEINNPLGVILCHLDLIKDDKTINEETGQDLQIIEKHAGNCKKIVADLLDFARQQKSAKKQIQINTLINDVVQILNKQFQSNDISLHLHLDRKLPELLVDPDKIKQVLMNILINGIHAIREHGNIFITTHYDEASKNITISIDDDGCGVDKELGPKIFDPFFTTKPAGQGTGLGLSVSYGIINEHNGDIRLTTTTDGLTSFTISLPTTTDTAHG